MAILINKGEFMMRFKNLVTCDNKPHTNKIYCMLSSSEYASNRTENLKTVNLIQSDLPFKLCDGLYMMVVNDVLYEVDVSLVQDDDYHFKVNVLVDDVNEFEISKLKKVNKYDLIREFIKNMKNF